MPWFKIDDTSHSHPKFIRAGNAALGLWLRCGAYAAQHLTEGVIPGVVAQLYGTVPQARKLVTVGLWHAHGHDCPRCPQPDSGDFVIHDFFEGGRNVTRAQHEANKKGAAERAAKSRASRKQTGSEEDSSSIRLRKEDESSAKTHRKEPHFQDSDAGQGGLSHRTPADTRAHALAKPSPPSPSEKEKEEGQLATRAGSDEPPRIGDRPRIPAASQPLVDALGAAGMLGIGWDLRPEEWFLVEALIDRCGIPALLASATASWQGARTRPRSGRYFLPAWRTLPDAPPSAAPGVNRLPAVRGGEVVALGKSRQQQETDDLFDRAMARAQARMQRKESS
ncbi:mucin-2 [Streptomyces sp. NPDC007100]|uniref:mucin-2 n=1 Tax=Streptomyces sp. NPDC007100 TaxID=3155602 RepID=UPI0033F89605